MRPQGCQSHHLRASSSRRVSLWLVAGAAVLWSWSAPAWAAVITWDGGGTDGSLADGLEGDALAGVAKRHVEARENILSAEQVESDTQARREADGRCQLDGSDANRQPVDIDRDRAAIAHYRISQLPSPEVKSQQSGFALGEDRDRSARVYIHPDFFPTTGTMQVQRDDGTWNPTKDAVPEGYRAHVKSSGRGTRRTEGITPGCFLCASVSSWTGSYPTNSSPSATTAYFPAYLSTSSSKCARIHAASSTRFCRILRLGITDTSSSRSLA